MASVGSLTMITGPILMTNLFGYFTSARAPLQLSGAPFLPSAARTMLALLLLFRRAADTVRPSTVPIPEESPHGRDR